MEANQQRNENHGVQEPRDNRAHIESQIRLMVFGLRLLHALHDILEEFEGPVSDAETPEELIQAFDIPKRAWIDSLVQCRSSVADHLMIPYFPLFPSEEQCPILEQQNIEDDVAPPEFLNAHVHSESLNVMGTYINAANRQLSDLWSAINNSKNDDVEDTCVRAYKTIWDIIDDYILGDSNIGDRYLNVDDPVALRQAVDNALEHLGLQ